MNQIINAGVGIITLLFGVAMLVFIGFLMYKKFKQEIMEDKKEEKVEVEKYE